MQMEPPFVPVCIRSTTVGRSIRFALNEMLGLHGTLVKNPSHKM